jgi:hypothetical protein
MCLTSSNKNTISSQFIQAQKLGSYLVYPGTRSGWSAGFRMNLPPPCFLHFLPTASAMACFLPFYDPNVPSSLRHGVPAAVNLSLPNTTSNFPHKDRCIRL